MPKRWIKMNDFWTLRPKSMEPGKQHLFECKDSKSSTGHSLLVKLAATHSGTVNGNRRFYRPDRMQDSCHTWTPNTYARPVLIEHDEQGEVVGRVREAKYIDESWKYASDYPILKDTVFYNTDARNRVDLYKSVDWIVDNLMEQDDYSGLGYIELGTQITNPKAIEKFLNDEYLTVSVGFKTDAAVCSICHTDWAQEDRCEHRPGEVVDGKQMFLISGNFDYSEVSVVNFPADPFATKLSMEQLSDSLHRKFYLGLSKKEQDSLSARTGLSLTDSRLFESDIDLIYEDQGPSRMDIKNTDLAALTKELKSPELTESRALEIKNALDEWNPESDSEKAKSRSLKSTLNARIKKEKWNKPTEPEIDAAVAAEMDAALEEPKVEQEKAEDKKAEEITWTGYEFADADEQAFFEDRDGLYEEITLEVGADAKLSAEAIAELADNVFVGPNRSLPAIDGKHIQAIRKLIEKSKISQVAKDKVFAHLQQRESALGIKSEETAATDTVSEKKYSDRTEKFGGDLLTDASGEEALTMISNLDKAYDASDSDIQSKMRMAVNAMTSDWDTDSWFAYAKSRLTEGEDSLSFIPSAELAEQQDTLNSLSEEKDALTVKLAAEQTKSVAFFNEAKKALASQVVMDKILTGADGYKDLTAEQIQDKVTEFSKRNIISLRDAVKDILADKKFIKPATQDANEPQVEVADNAKVSESDSVTKNTDSVAEEKAPEAVINWSALRYMSPLEKTMYLAELRFSK